MKTENDNQKVEELLTRGVEEIIESGRLKKRLEKGEKLRIKFGIDPTSPNIHIGRAVPLLKLRDFQEFGHKIILIIGDFTGVIGDTSDKDSERPMLGEDQIGRNMKDYTKQAEKIIDVGKCEIRHNSEWLGKLNYHEIGKQANIFSLNEFTARENIKKRLDAGKRVSLRELLYPLMQGYDSVAVKADVEIGGTDQRFNLLAGRELQRYYKQSPQDIVTNPLIEGLDGRKMSSSWGNTINVGDSPNEMYGKVMSLKDELIIKYFILTTRARSSEIEEYKKELESGGNPKDCKMKLAFEITAMYHGKELAENAEKEFEKIFKNKEIPSEIAEIKIEKKDLNLLDLLVFAELAVSKSEAKRLVLQGGVKINKNIEKDWKKIIGIGKGMVIQVGKRKFVKII